VGSLVTADTAWRSGRFDAAAGPHRLLFGEMYEDADIELAAFRGKGRVFCIASAGSTARRLAVDHDVVACDINATQLEYAQRRAAGGRPETGDAERAMSLVRLFMPLIGWRKENVERFLSLSDTRVQVAYWQTSLDTRRFRAGFDLLLSPAFLRVMYASRFLAILPPHFGRIVRRRFERCVSRHANASNPYLRMLLLGDARSDQHVTASNIRFVLADAASFLESCPKGSFEGFSLSNILDGARPSYGDRLLSAVRHAASPDAVVVSRSFAEPSEILATNHAECDRSPLWGIVDVRSAR
jgi:S-adenosylmethionine:diacylglycerol 3-amino-3-carboxypropyl transferase